VCVFPAVVFVGALAAARNSFVARARRLPAPMSAGAGTAAAAASSGAGSSDAPPSAEAVRAATLRLMSDLKSLATEW
jgi:hypothetical protein